MGGKSLYINSSVLISISITFVILLLMSSIEHALY